MRKNTHHKNINDQTAQQSKAALNQVIEIGLFDLFLLVPVNIPRLHKGRMQIQIVRHDNGTYDAHRLQKGVRIAVGAPGEEEAFHKFTLVRSCNDVFVSESYRHDSYEDSEKHFQFS